jgi:hypothetical protein
VSGVVWGIFLFWRNEYEIKVISSYHTTMVPLGLLNKFTLNPLLNNKHLISLMMK